ncbi:MAG: sulfite oxidase-like oxidoreductase [Thermoleophilia bacterium]
MGLLRNRRLTEDQLRRIPPGQHLVSDFPVLHEGSVPYESVPDGWDFTVTGGVERPGRWTYRELRALPSRTVTTDIHCVTTWSKLDTRWEGVPVWPLLQSLGVHPDVTHVIAIAEAGYTANLPLERLDAEDVLLAYRFDDEELEPVHGGPLRLLVPGLYFWKSAKWLRGLELVTRDRPGFWERLGYSNSADPWKEERYAF